jgi:MinD superfamily P-loop ATPase
MNMKEVVIISGKVGTVKTSFTASFAALAADAVFADCDVDAADLHLLLHPVVRQQELFRSGKTAVINTAACTQCGQCREHCRFEAIEEVEKAFTVNAFACEGCAVCSHVCPVNAIEMQENVCGEWYLSDTQYGPMVHAKLGIAEENSGKLVSLVRQQAQRVAEVQQIPLILIDGPPGIGCPVISSITGASMVLVVTEPTLSGIHDLQRVAELTAHFDIPTGVCVNKATINPDMTRDIHDFCATHELRFLGEIPYDRVMVDALLEQKSVVEYSDGLTAAAIRQIWERMEQWRLE